MSDFPIILAVVGVVWNPNKQIGWHLSLQVALLSKTPDLSTVLIENELQDIYGAQRALHEQFEQLHVNYNEEKLMEDEVPPGCLGRGYMNL